MKRNYALAVQPVSRGIKCDHCKFIDELVPLSRSAIKAYTNKPCPQCGENLLTEDCAKSTLLIMRVAAVVSFILLPYMAVKYLLFRVGIIKEMGDYGARIKFKDSGEIEMEDPKKLK